MDIEGREESKNVEDQRGSGGKTGLAIGGAGGVVVVILCLIFGVDPRNFVGGGGQPNGQQGQVASPEEEKMVHFAKVVFHDTEVVWDEQFTKMGKTYQKPILHLFTSNVDTGCGKADAGMGPFYCPADRKVYIDLSFYQVMDRKLHAPGDFARAYVIAHEVGHHVQNLLGYAKRAQDAERAMAKEDRHQMSVRLELQADYFAGVWAYYGQKQFKFLQKGDLESALNAASQIGDDKLQKQATGYVVPDKFTHGTSKQRVYWFEKGFETGDVGGAKELFSREYSGL